MSPGPGARGPGGEPIGEPHRKLLLAAARRALEGFLGAGETPAPVPRPGDPDIPHFGVFVTLRRRGQLRGCIGNMDPARPLAAAVRSCAVSAAGDPRFEPLQDEELGSTVIEISVLGPGRPVSGPEEIRIGLDGLRIRSGWRRGILLPQVATDRGWDGGRFLEELCRKAGLPPGAWRARGAEVEAFEAEVFGEEEPGATAAPPGPRC